MVVGLGREKSWPILYLSEDLNFESGMSFRLEARGLSLSIPVTVIRYELARKMSITLD